MFIFVKLQILSTWRKLNIHFIQVVLLFEKMSHILNQSEAITVPILLLRHTFVDKMIALEFMIVYIVAVVYSF